MAITPEQALALTPQDLRDICDNERLIDLNLIDRLSPIDRTLTISLGKGIRAKVREELLQRYRNAGWSVSFQTSFGETSMTFMLPDQLKEAETLTTRGNQTTLFERIT